MSAISETQHSHVSVRMCGCLAKTPPKLAVAGLLTVNYTVGGNKQKGKKLMKGQLMQLSRDPVAL